MNKIALMHYWFITWRGGEKVVDSILQLFPDADIYTLFIDDKISREKFPRSRVKASVLNNFSFLRKNHQKIFPLYPLGVQSIRLKKHYDLIISSESGPIKGVRFNKKNTKHICYIHTPMRYCWGYEQEYINSISILLRPIVKGLLRLLRQYDKITVKNVDLYVANSKNVQERVNKYYDREAVVVYPPIDLKIFDREMKIAPGKYYLSFGAITPYKRIDLLVAVFNKLGYPIVIIGEGSERKKLEEASHSNIKFLGHVKDEMLADVIVNAKALVFPGEEDFGMVPIEVMGQGVPTIAFASGGALETVIEGEKGYRESSGILFYEQTVESLIDAIKCFEENEMNFDPNWIRCHARAFGEDVFQNKMMRIIEEVIGE